MKKSYGLLLLSIVLMLPWFFWGGPDYYALRSYKFLWSFGHIVFFALLFFWAFLSVTTFSKRPFYIHVVVVLILTTFLGAVIEWIQSGVGRDVDWYDMGRVPKYVEAARRLVNEVYFLPLNKKDPELSDLLRFAIGPKGSETTGTYFTPDGSTMFLNIQHPWPRNKAPFNRSTTVAITGFK